MRLAWAVSGRGVTAQAVAAASEAGLLATRLDLIVVDRPSEIEAFAAGRGIPCRMIPWNAGSRADFQAAFRAAVTEAGADWLGLTFNQLLSGETIAAMAGRIFNLHFALLPLFPGAGATRKAISSGMRLAGVTVHLVDEGMDTGPILAQAVCPILPGDDAALLGRRQFETSLPLVLQVVRAIERGELRLDAAGKPDWPLPIPASFAGAYPAIDDDLAEFAARFCRNA